MRFASSLKTRSDQHFLYNNDRVLLVDLARLNKPCIIFQVDYAVVMLGTVAAGGALTPANPAYTAKELHYQLEQTKAKIVIASEETLAVALEAAKLAGIPKSNVLVFGNREINGTQPYTKVLLADHEMEAVEYSYEEACNTIAYLCFSSGTTGKCKPKEDLNSLSVFINI